MDHQRSGSILAKNQGQLRLWTVESDLQPANVYLFCGWQQAQDHCAWSTANSRLRLTLDDDDDDEKLTKIACLI